MSAEEPDVGVLVRDLMREANSMPPGREDIRLVNLRKAKELILTKIPDLIDNFWAEMTATRHDRATNMVLFCLEWIQDACAREPAAWITHGIPIVLQLIEHQSILVQKRSLDTARMIFQTAFCWIVQPNKDLDAKGEAKLDASKKIVWTELTKVKVHLTKAIGEDYDHNHISYRLRTYKFVETVIVAQTPRDLEAEPTADDPACSLDIPSRFQFMTREAVEDDANQMLQLLEYLLTDTEHDINYVDRECVIACLFHIARRRPQFLSRMLSAVEFVHGNIPETYSKSEVEGLRKYVKAGLMSVLRRSDDGDMLARTVLLLTTLGASNNEIGRARPKLQEALKRKRTDSTSDSPPKRLKSYDDPRSAVVPDLATSDPQALAVDINFKAISEKLTQNHVIELVLANMRRLPSAIPAQFHATYTPIGSGPSDQVLHNLARLMAVQMVAAGVGPGPKEINRRRQEEMSIRNQMDTLESENRSPQPIAVVGRQNSVVVVKSEEAAELDEDGGNSNDSTDAKKMMEEMGQETPAEFKATDKAFRLTEITEPIPQGDRGNAILSIVNEIISNDASVLNAAGEFLYHKCLIRFAVRIGLDALRDRIMKYIMDDVGTRLELAFRWIYEEYTVARQMTRNAVLDHTDDEMTRYDDCLTKFIRGFIDHQEYREGHVSALYLEVPVITDGAVDLLSYYCSERNLHGAMRLIQKLVLSRPNADRFIVPVLEMTLHQRKDIQPQAVQTCVKIYKTVPELRETIREYAMDSIKLLCDAMKPPSWFFSEKYGRGEKLSDYSWSEEHQKLCTTLFTGLLSEDPTLLPILGVIYVDHPSDVKKTIFKVIEQPIKAVGMNSPEVLAFVKSPPKGSESLVLRIIHLLTETHPATPELIASIRSLYSERIPDVRFLIPILNGLPKEDIFAALPKLIKLNPVVVQEVFHRLLGTGKHKQDATQRKPSVTPAEVLVELHKIDLGKVDSKTLIKATGLCLAEKELYSSETMIAVLKALIEIEPLPFLLMRTVLQTIQMHPRSLFFIMNILQRLIAKEVWNMPLLWEGFVRCCEKTFKSVPSSYQVILLLPASKLLALMESHPGLQAGLQQYLATSLDRRERSFMSQAVLNVVRTGQLDLPADTVLEEDPVDVVGVIAPLISHNGSRVTVIKLEEDASSFDQTSRGAGAGRIIPETAALPDSGDMIVKLESPEGDDDSQDLTSQPEDGGDEDSTPRIVIDE